MCLSQLLGPGTAGAGIQARRHCAGARGRPAGQGHPGGRASGVLAPGSGSAEGLQGLSSRARGQPGLSRQLEGGGRWGSAWGTGDPCQGGHTAQRPETRGAVVTGRLHSPKGSSSSDPIPAPAFVPVKLLNLRLIVDPPVVVKNSPEGGCLHFALFSPSTSLQNPGQRLHQPAQHYRPSSTTSCCHTHASRVCHRAPTARRMCPVHACVCGLTRSTANPIPSRVSPPPSLAPTPALRLSGLESEVCAHVSLHTRYETKVSKLTSAVAAQRDRAAGAMG